MSGADGWFLAPVHADGDGKLPLVDQADAVVSTLDLRDARCKEVAHALNVVAADTRVVVLARGSAARWSAELPACEVVAGPLSAEVLVGSLSSDHGEEVVSAN